MTNGEKIKEIFPSMIVGFVTESRIGVYFEKNQHSANVFDLDWWNAEYKEPTNKENSLEKREPCINCEDGCEEWAGCPCVYYRTESEET